MTTAERSGPKAAEPQGRRSTIRVGLVGGGLMAKTHSLAYANLRIFYGDDDLPLVVRRRVADISESLAADAAERYGWEAATGDWRQITRAPDIELVDIATPNDTHAEIAVDAARHGKHVLCEKPLAHRLDDAQAMYRAFKDAGVAHQVDFVYRKWPAIQHAKRLLSHGELGQVRQFRARFFHDYASDPKLPLTWRFQRQRAGAGSVGDIGSHLIDLGRFFLGEIDRVMARTFTFVKERPLDRGDDVLPEGHSGHVDVDDAAQVWLEFANGASGNLETNWMATGHKTDLSFELIGDGGSLAFSWLTPNELQLYSEADPVETRGFRSIIIGPQHPGAGAFWPVPGQGLGWGDAFLISVRDLLSSIARGAAPEPGFLDGLRTAEVVDAALKSARTRSWVEVRRSE
jgi:levoglucosan dehydrogenase